jgi:hypothetical protein
VPAALEGSLKAISDIRKDLQHDIIRDANSNIAKAQKQCLEIAEKLLKVLESIKASSQTAKSKFLKDVSATWQVMRARSKIDKLEQELRVAQNHFKEALTVETRNAIAQVLERQGKDTTMLQSLWDEIQKIRPELQQARKENNAAHRETLLGVARIEKAYTTQQTITQSTQQATLGAIENLDINVQAQFNDKRMTDVHHEILGTLRYPDMLVRQQEISPPVPGTYEWVFTGESPYQNDPDIDKYLLSADLERREKLLHWFSTDESLFWINGKPGSGKSSLMSFLANDERTLQALDSWSGQRSVHIIKFFFWRPGSPLQRSVSGLLRSLLYQTLMIDTSVIDRLLAEKSLRRHPTWEQSHLLRTLETVLKLQSKEHICFFIDGLDEHDGEYMTLLDLVLRTQATPNVKICLSSRSEPAFRLRLSACPSISMQDLNKHDIETLAQQKLEPLGSTFTSLIEEVTERAEGIILWAALVCNSLLRGYTTYDDEPMLRKRLDETPSGLRELFRHMFSKIDNAHRDDLRTYCHILKWASEIKYKTYYTSLTFVTAVSQSSGITSMADFVKICPSREQQIVAQSQGLIEVGRQENNPVLGLWSIRQTVDQGIVQSQTHDLTKELFEYSRHHIRWVHRSAHDCIFGERSETIAQWIFLDDDLELKKKSVDCLLWLAEHLPMFSMSKYEENASQLAAFDDLIRDIILLTSYDEGFQIAGKLHDLIASAFPGQDRRHCRKELQDIAGGGFSDVDEMLPLYSLWVGILEIGRHGYFDHLVQKPFAAQICRSLIWNDAAGGDDALRCLLLSHVLRYFQPWTNSKLVSGGFLHNRQFGYRQHGRRFSQSPVNPIIISWQGSRDHDEAGMIHDLAIFRGSACDPSLSNRFWQQVLELFEAREVWRGPQAVDEDDQLLPLQLILPNSGFLQMWAASQSSAIPSSALPASRFRIMCLRRHQQIYVSQTLPHEVTHAHEAVAMFDLSSTATEALLLQSQWWTSDATEFPTLATASFLEMTWVGTDADYSSCVQVIIDDIWQDRDQQLDAWQQLYILACVKLCFGRMWKIGNEARVARWLETPRKFYFEALSASESSSDDGLESERDPLEEAASDVTPDHQQAPA